MRMGDNRDSVRDSYLFFNIFTTATAFHKTQRRKRLHLAEIFPRLMQNSHNAADVLTLDIRQSPFNGTSSKPPRDYSKGDRTSSQYDSQKKGQLKTPNYLSISPGDGLEAVRNPFGYTFLGSVEYQVEEVSA